MLMNETHTHGAASTPESTPKKRRIVLVDDHPILRQGLARLINHEPDLLVCGEAESAPEAITLLEQAAPDLAVVDVTLSGMDGIELIKELKTKLPALPVLVLSMHAETLYAERALRAGAKGYLTKQEAPETILVAIRRILTGGIYVSDQVAEKVLHSLSAGKNGRDSAPIERLSDRELQVFQMIGQGMTVREIAERLFLSAKTVEAHRERMKEKLSLKSSAELLRYAIQHSLGKG